MKVKVYRGTQNYNPLIRAGRHVAKELKRAANYARYPDNGDAKEGGFIFELEVDESEVHWDARGDCNQGRLKIDVIAKQYAACELPLTVERKSIIRIKLDDSCEWADGTKIEWKPVNSD